MKCHLDSFETESLAFETAKVVGGSIPEGLVGCGGGCPLVCHLLVEGGVEAFEEEEEVAGDGWGGGLVEGGCGFG